VEWRAWERGTSAGQEVPGTTVRAEGFRPKVRIPTPCCGRVGLLHLEFVRSRVDGTSCDT
jgi:hypothetical protein